MRVFPTNEIGRFLTKNLDSFDISGAIPSFSPVVAHDVVTEVKIVDSGKQFSETIGLGLSNGATRIRSIAKQG